MGQNISLQTKIKKMNKNEGQGEGVESLIGRLNRESATYGSAILQTGKRYALNWVRHDVELKNA